jgi:serine protease Do
MSLCASRNTRNRRAAALALTVLTAFAAAIFPALNAAPAKITLNQGGVVQGEVLGDKPDKIVVDLGFTILAIPRDAIAAVESLQASGKAKAASVFNADLFREGASEGVSEVRELATKVGPAVVQVNASMGLGSGFIIHPDGYLLTNDHVIAGSNALSVTVFKGVGKNMQKRKYDNVRIIATDGQLDLALLKIEDADGERFPTVPLGSSETLRQGAQVVAVGSPLGLERSVSTGIVSLRNRQNVSNASLLVQTTAQINPGNSGGPLFNMRGEVIGVNELKISFGAEGLGFAIRVDTVKDFLRNREAYAFDPANPNDGYRYLTPPTATGKKPETKPKAKK